MHKPVMFLVGVVLAAVGWIVYENYGGAADQARFITQSPIEPNADADQGPLAPLKSTVQRLLGTESSDSQPGSSEQVIRVATFNINVLDEAKSYKPRIMDILARIGRQFDVIAVQGIQSKTDDIAPRLVDLMNKTGLEFDFAIGPRLGPENAEEQYAFVFNQHTVVIDRAELYTVDDPDNLLLREPFVAWFRAVGPDTAQAFTFSVVNFKVDPGTVAHELSVLHDVLLAVQDDGREEDDIILAGDFQAAPTDLGRMNQITDLAAAVSQVPTNTDGTATWSNILVRKKRTVEFNGRGGVFDFLRQYNMNLNEALEVSDHLPVWAEFSIFEGGRSGRVARKADQAAQH